MRIGIVLPRFCRFSATHPTSIDSVVRDFAEASRYHDSINVIGPAVADPIDTVQFTPVDADWSHSSRIPQYIRLLREQQPDLIEVHQHLATAKSIAMAMPETPVALVRHDLVKAPTNLLATWRYVNRLRGIRQFVFVSHFLCDRFKRDYPSLADRALAVPNAIGTDDWLGPLDGKEKTIAFVGRAAPEKGLAELCDALPRILTRHPDWRAVIIGGEWGNHAEWAEAQVAKLADFGERVVVLRDQPRNAVKQHLWRAAISVVPSVWEEPFGLVALEAHLAGAAVISSGRGGLREASGTAALFLPDVTPKCIGDAIHTLIADDARRMSLAEAGQTHTYRQFDIANRVPELDSLRDRLMSQPRQRSVLFQSLPSLLQAGQPRAKIAPETRATQTAIDRLPTG